MRKKIVALIVIVLFTLTVIFSVSPANAQAQGSWITSYSVRNLSTGEIILQKTDAYSPATAFGNLLEGTDVNVTITISVSQTGTGSLTLSTALQKALSQDKYWELKTTAYPVQNYNPNAQSVTFNQTQGQLVISCYGTIPTGLTTSSSGSGIQMHLAAPFVLIRITGPSGTLDQIAPQVIDAKIAQYNTLHDTSVNALENLKTENAAAAYVALYENVINGSELAASAGFVDNAISQLNQLAISEQPPVTAGASMFDTLFLPVAGALAVVAVIGIVLFLRAKGRAGYVSQVVEDQIRDLEGLTLRAQRIDKTLSQGLETIEDRLKRAVGA